MYINQIEVNTRHNRPTTLSRTALLTYFINDGQYQDPYQISAVSIFRLADNQFPSSVISSDGEILNSASSLILANFANSAALTSDIAFNASNYSVGASGIYKLGTGIYAVVLDPNIDTCQLNLSGTNDLDYRLSATGDYIDVWTVRRVVGSDLDTIINDFTFRADRFINTTERLLFRVATRLENAYLILGSKIDLKFTNEFTIENTNIDRSVCNLFKDSLVMNPMLEIYKENTDKNLPARVTVSSFAQTSALCDVTSDNTVTFTFDTSTLSTHPQLLNGNLGAMTGVYTARLKFNALDQVIYSNYMPLQLR